MSTIRQLFLSNLAQTSETPLALEIEHADGLYLFDTNGKKYLDLISGISVSNLGHRHPKVIEAIKAQLEQYTYLMVYGEYIQSPQVQFAKLLTENLPNQLESVYFVNSGSEATEGALKLAKRYTGRSEIIYFSGSYHGSTHGALSVMGDERFKNAFRPLLPGTRQLQYNDPKDLKYITEKTACVILEPIQAESGITVPDKSYMKALRVACNETGALLILDEVQTGLGRTGSLFAFGQFDIIPDILLLAKALGGGMPIGAFISSAQIMSAFQSNPILGHITTFGGHPVSCAAGLASLKYILESDLIKEVKTKEALFKKLLQHDKINSAGLMLSLALDSFETNKKIIDECIENGIIVDWFLFADHCLRIAPPLIISEKEIHQACEVINESIRKHS